MEKRVAILQSSYIPWRGYFDMIRSVDHFLLYDEVQYTRRDWRNRNRIRTAAGVRWLTVPVKVKGRFEQRIDETEIDGTAWASKHWRTLEHSYGSAPHWARVADRSSSSSLRRRSRSVAAQRPEPPLTRDSAGSCSRSRRRSRGRRTTPRSPGGTSDSSASASSWTPTSTSRDPRRAPTSTKIASPMVGLRVEWFDYPSYARYPQVHGGWEPNLSVLDLLFNVGAYGCRGARARRDRGDRLSAARRRRGAARRALLRGEAGRARLDGGRRRLGVSQRARSSRFEQLLRVVDRGRSGVTLNDFGCGYGALAGPRWPSAGCERYVGFDLSEAMIEAAQTRARRAKTMRFVLQLSGSRRSTSPTTRSRAASSTCARRRPTTPGGSTCRS